MFNQPEAHPMQKGGLIGQTASVDADELESELKAILVRFEDVLEANELYGIEVLHRRGAKGHDWFAGVRPGKGTAKLMLLPIKSNPELLDGVSPALRKRVSGDALFTLKPGDEGLLPELEQVVARAFDVYVGTPPDGDG
jgi:hypothetical protein